MLTMQIPTVLVLLATALMAVVIFAPERVAASPAISFAPPLAPPPERWDAEIDAFFDPVAPALTDAPAFARTAMPPRPPAWPTLIDPRAAGCDVPARLALVDALAEIRAPWARSVLERVLDDETDPGVRSAVLATGVCEPPAAG